MTIEGRKGWYKDFLILPCTGFVPGKGPRDLYTNSVCRERLGPNSDNGRYAWRHCFDPAYQSYIEELFERVYQRKLGGNELIPWHFACVILSEFDGAAVNWSSYAVSLRRRGSRGGSLKILPKYKGLRHPLQSAHPRPLAQAPSSETSSVSEVLQALPRRT
ncbi:hypothetical protein M758_UG143300 [Ceratodon purpureus]|nr:hypothetical protein M758_UG143300 [Ceratodon purpureus]